MLKGGGISCKNPRAAYCVATPLHLTTHICNVQLSVGRCSQSAGYMLDPQNSKKILSIIVWFLTNKPALIPAFRLGKVAGEASQGDFAVSHSFRSLIVAPYQDRTRLDRRCYHATWSLAVLWTAFPWGQPAGLASQISPEIFISFLILIQLSRENNRKWRYNLGVFYRILMK